MTQKKLRPRWLLDGRARMTLELAKEMLAALAASELQCRLEESNQEADVELIGEASELLELQRGEVARLIAQVRWLEGKPYRSKPEKVAAGQLAFDLIAMMKNAASPPALHRSSGSSKARASDLGTSLPRRAKIRFIDRQHFVLARHPGARSSSPSPNRLAMCCPEYQR